MGWLILNKKSKIFVSLKIILIIVLIYVYKVNGKELYFNGVYESLGEILGGFKTVLIPYLILNILSEFIIDREKKIVFLMRLNFFCILIIFLNNLQLLFYVDNMKEDNLEKIVFTYLNVHKNLGLLVTMILYKLYFLVSININIAITGVIIFFSSFILFGKVIGNIVRKILNYFAKENRNKRKKRMVLLKDEKKIKKQIIIKEKKDRIEQEKQIVIEEKIEKERKIKILELRKKIIKNNDSSLGKQLKIIGVKAITNDNLSVKEVGKNNKKIVTVTKGQLYFEFKKEEV